MQGVGESKALKFALRTFRTAPYSYRNLCDKILNYCLLQSMIGRLFEGRLCNNLVFGVGAYSMVGTYSRGRLIEASR